MQLALGTVQFGLRYGVAGRGERVPEVEVRAILRRAAEVGISLLDTAAAYGDIEERLADLIGCAGLRVVSKLPARPDGLSLESAGEWAAHCAERSIRRLGPALTALMFHRADDLLDVVGDAAWAGASKVTVSAGLRLGVSAYDPATAARVRERHSVSIAQLPGNALDQSLLLGPPMGCEVHLRSAFLQGLLLMPADDAARRVPAAAPALARWHDWCAQRALSPLVAALGCAKAMPASHCVVGVDSLEQLEQIAQAWAAAPVLSAPELASTDRRSIDPRCWPTAP